jgi:peptide deformylase
MPLLPIIIAPDPKLKMKCKPVETVDDDVRRLLDDMLATMYDAPGIGLAAPQIGVARRLVVLDVEKPAEREAGKEPPGRPIRLVNPEVVWVSDELNTHEEGCLSVPGIFADVTRPAACRVRYLDEQGKKQELIADGILATCVQHEIDHLDGILFTDHLTALKRNIIMKKMVKAKKQKAKDEAA